MTKIQALLTKTDIESFFMRSCAIAARANTNILLSKEELLLVLGIKRSKYYELLKAGMPRIGNKFNLSDVMQFLDEYNSSTINKEFRRKTLY